MANQYENLSDRQFCKQVSELAEQILAEHLPEGIVVRRGNASYGAGSFTLKLDFSRVGEDGVVNTPERTAFINYIDMKSNGVLSADDIDATFQSNNKTFTVVGLKTRSRKRPIICESSDGKQYVFPINDVIRLLGREPKTFDFAR